MPERGSGDGPDYGWLYGKKGNQPPSGSGDPEPTQMLPKIDRPTSAPPRRPDQPTQGAAQRPVQPTQRVVPPKDPPAAPPKSTGPRGPGRKIRWGKVVVVLLVAWLVYLVAVPLWAWSNIEKVDADPAGARPAEQPGTTYLLVGSDSRKGLSAG